MPAVICELESGESMLTERGSMSWMSPNMAMSTGAGGVGKAFGRMFSGDAMFAFASSFPGAIRAVTITPEHPVVTRTVRM